MVVAEDAVYLYDMMHDVIRQHNIQLCVPKLLVISSEVVQKAVVNLTH